MVNDETHNEKWRETISERQEKLKEQFLATLEDQPIIRVGCKRAGVSPATYYRWIHDDYSFYEKVVKAQKHGRENWNDLAESKLMQKVRDGDLNAIKYYLDRMHPLYRQKSIFERDRTERLDHEEYIRKFILGLEEIVAQGGVKKSIRNNKALQALFEVKDEIEMSKGNLDVVEEKATPESKL